MTAVDPLIKKTTDWRFEALGNNNLQHLGIAVKTDFKPGSQYTFFYTPARDGSNSSFISGLTIAGKHFQIVKF